MTKTQSIRDQFPTGTEVTYGTSKLIWIVDEVQYGIIYLNRQHMKPNSRRHLSFKQVEEEDVAKLHIVPNEDCI